MSRETRKKLKELRAQLYQVENYNVTTDYEEQWRKSRIAELSVALTILDKLKSEEKSKYV